MSTDAQRIADITQYGTILWSGIFQMTLAFVSLYQLLGWQVRKHSSACPSLLTLTFRSSTDAYRRRRDGLVFPDQRSYRKTADTHAEEANEKQGLQDSLNERDSQ